MPGAAETRFLGGAGTGVAGAGLAGITPAGVAAGGAGSRDSSAGAVEGLNFTVGTDDGMLLGFAVTTPGVAFGSRIGAAAAGTALTARAAGLAAGAASTMRMGGSVFTPLPLVANDELEEADPTGVAMVVRTELLSDGRSLAAGTSTTGTLVADSVGVAGGGV